MLREYRPEEWCWDRYAKACDRCDTIVGRYSVMAGDDGTRHVVWWPHKEWDGVMGPYRCSQHPSAPRWRHLRVIK